MAELAPTLPLLRLVRDEASPAYDGQERRAPFCMTPRALITEHGARLGMTAVGVYLALQTYTDNAGVCWPSHDAIAAMCGVSRWSVMRAIAALEANGWVIQEKRTRGPHGRDSNRYTLPHIVNQYVPHVHIPTEVSSTDAHTEGEYVANENKVSSKNEGRYVAPVLQELDTSELDTSELDTPPLSPKGNGRAKPEDYTEGFEAFWSAYPRRDQRKGAAKWWAKHKPDSDLLQRILMAIEQQGLARREYQYRPMPTTWLNGERWNDERPAPTTNGAANGRASPEPEPVMSDDGGLSTWREMGQRRAAT